MLRILALSALLPLFGMMPERAAAFQDTIPGKFSLRVSFEKAFRSWIIDEVTLDSAGSTFYPASWIDSSTKNYTLAWKDLKAGDYRLRIETYFGEGRNLSVRVARDTAFTIRSWYTVLDSLSLDRFLEAGPIRVYHFSYGCFGGHIQVLAIDTLIKKRRLTCTVTDYMSRNMDSIGRKWAVTIPITRKVRANRIVVTDLKKLLIDCMKQEVTQAEDVKCASTAGQSLIVRAGDGIYTFRDYGLCLWDDYRPFIEKYNPAPRNRGARRRREKHIQRLLRARSSGIIVSRN